MGSTPSLLKKATNQSAFAKVGVFGFPGSGKTHTAMLIAQGLAKKTGAKNIGFFDTEKGSDWWVNRMDKGLELYSIKSSSFNDLLQVIHEAPNDGIPILVIDSITHVWRSLVDAYQAKFNKQDMSMLDWTKVKKQWAKYTMAFINSPVHIIVCGRAGHTYDFEKNSYGKIEPKKTGTKMKAEVEFEFEPDLVIEMTAEQAESGLINMAHVKKDRSDNMNGKNFNMPTFKNFEPHFNGLNIGGSHVGLEKNKSEFKESQADPAPDPKQNLKKKSGSAF